MQRRILFSPLFVLASCFCFLIEPAQANPIYKTFGATTLVVLQGTGEPLPATPAEQRWINKIEKTETRFDRWANRVCPIYAGVVRRVSMRNPQVGDRLADIFVNAVCAVADGYKRAIDVYLAICQRQSGGSSDACEFAALMAKANIDNRKNLCENEIRGAEPPS